MKLSLDLRTSLSQTLTPQQIQYLKLLQLPVVQLEQQVKQEIEQNPMLEEADDFSSDSFEDSSQALHEFSPPESDSAFEEEYSKDHSDYSNMIDDESDPFEFHKLLYEDSSPDFASKLDSNAHDEDDPDNYQIKDSASFIEDLQNQLRLIPLNIEEYLLGDQIIGSIDSDGYLRRELLDITEETNETIEKVNVEILQRYRDLAYKEADVYNPARQYAISTDSYKLLKEVHENNPEIRKPVNNGYDSDDEYEENNGEIELLNKVSLEQAEKVLSLIQSLDPPGVGSRNIQECLIAQCKALPKHNAAQKLGLAILEEAYEAFSKKHYHIIKKQLEVTDEYLKDALDVIRRLNPKPGAEDNQHEMNTLIPDFVIDIDEDTNEITISVNDTRIPQLKLSSAYEKMKKEAKYKLFNKETREWIRNKYEDAKFLIQALRQRKNTMLKVMTAIAQTQKEFFFEGQQALKPLIYKNIAEETGLDISTICRIVNGKYALTKFGTFELKYFFSESLPNSEGEEISTRVIKNIIKEIIDSEDKSKPFSDDKLMNTLKEQGYNVARRTIAKYREQLKIPVARLRKEL